MERHHGVQAHSGSQGKGVVAEQAHEYRKRPRGQAGEAQDGAGREGGSGRVGDVAQNCRVDEDDVGHHQEGGKAGPSLHRQGGPALAQQKGSLEPVLGGGWKAWHAGKKGALWTRNTDGSVSRPRGSVFRQLNRDRQRLPRRRRDRSEKGGAASIGVIAQGVVNSVVRLILPHNTLKVPAFCPPSS